MPVTAEPVGDVAAVLGEGPYWRPEDEALLWVDVARGHLHMTRTVGPARVLDALEVPIA